LKTQALYIFQKLRKILVIIFKCTIIIVTLTICNTLVIIAFSHSYIHTTTKNFPHAQVAVILGAAILKDGSLSPVLMDRVTKAISLYKNRNVENILVTGDNGTLAYNEVNPVRLYLLAHGIPDKDIFLDHAGFDTYSSMYRARDIFLAQSMIIVSQSFHLPRAVFIARNLGIDAYGVNADNGHYLLKNYIREIFANCKAVMNLLVHRQPKYLGKEIPLTGDGRDNQ
jgi:SanA protein